MFLSHLQHKPVLLILIIFIAILLYAGIYDLINKKIPNLLSVSITVLGFIYNYLSLGNIGLTIAFYGLLTGFFISLLFYLLANLGAGDVKLIASVGSFIGSKSIILIIGYSYMISAVLGIIFIKFWLMWYENKKSRSAISTQKKILSQKIPMAPGISMATIYVLYLHHLN